ncbi:MAG TPA: M56 family metallopeptidase [Gemmataceae bacterium]|jgi:beta-lactamase regulating signal transducer with metallopeptidase domain
MSAPYFYLLGPTTLLFLANWAIASCLASGLGLLAVWVCRGRSASIRHGLLLATVALLAASPILLAVTNGRGWHAVPLTLSAAEEGDAARLAASEAEASFPFSPADGGDRPARATVEPWRVAATFAAYLWAEGIAAGGVRLLRRLRTLQRFRRSFVPARRGESSDREAAVYESSFTQTPLVVGLWRPVIVLPAGLADELTAEQLRLVVRHEQAHIRRRDPWAVLLQGSMIMLFWWNPLVHAISVCLSRLREQLCDDCAASSPKEGRQLAEALVRVAERTIRANPFPSVALFDAGASDIEERVRRLLARTRPGGRLGLSGRVAIGVFGVLAIGLLLIAGLRAAPIHPTTLSASSEGALSVVPDDAGQGLIAPPDAIAGQWLMTLPAGFRHRITFSPLGQGRYRFEPRKLVMSGVYTVKDDRLVIVAPNDKRLTGFEWQTQQDGSLTLIGEPGVAKTGSSYLKATMRRLAN